MIAARVCGTGGFADAVADWLDAEHYVVARSPTVDHAIGAIDPAAPGLVALVDDAADDLPRLLAASPGACIVVALAQASVARTVQLMQRGARSVVCTRASLIEQVRAVLAATQPEALRPRWTPSERAIFSAIVTRSPAMATIMEQIRSVARTPDTTVVIVGESGTGKELVANATHQLSHRAKQPLIAVNCGAIPEALFESELFGHERGAFSGATEDRKGRLELADGGTIFLDEIGELPLAMQAKLLRVLEDRQVWRVGACAPRPVDVRVIAASNRDLRVEVNEKRFRADLFYRLNVLRVTVPPLRERDGDVELLAAHFWRMFRPEQPPPASLLRHLAAQRWPGNVRELRNAIERAAHLGWTSSPAAATPAAAVETLTYQQAKERAVWAWERRWIEELIHAAGGNLSRASRAAKMGRSHVRELAKRHGVVTRGHVTDRADDDAETDGSDS